MLALSMALKLDEKCGDYGYLMSILTDYDIGGMENMPVDVLTRGLDHITLGTE